jgi:hypothetical protein
MPPAVLEPEIPAKERLLYHTSERVFTGIGWVTICVQLIRVLSVDNYYNPSYLISDE